MFFLPFNSAAESVGLLSFFTAVGTEKCCPPNLLQYCFLSFLTLRLCFFLCVFYFHSKAAWENKNLSSHPASVIAAHAELVSLWFQVFVSLFSSQLWSKRVCKAPKYQIHRITLSWYGPFLSLRTLLSHFIPCIFISCKLFPCIFISFCLHCSSFPPRRSWSCDSPASM